MSLLAVLLASILGSPHCAGMCGGFALFCSGGGGKGLAPTFLYNIGRLATYLALGAIAGAAGASVDSLLGESGLEQGLPIALGLLLIFWGIAQLFGWQRFSTGPSSGLVSIARKGVARLESCPPTLRALIVGTSSTLLPCGWLYSFLLLAAASGSVTQGMLVMAVFWVGTVPMMLTIGEFSRRFLTKWGAQIPAVTASLLIVAGLFSIAAHTNWIPGSHAHCSTHNADKE